MRIGIVWHCDYPWDIRIEKFAKSLQRAGNQVVVFARGRNALPAVDESSGIRVRRVYFRVPFLAKLVSLPVFFNPFWLARLVRLARDERVDFLLVRDLPLAFLAGVAGRALGIPVALDMAENYPAALKTYNRPLLRPFLLGDAWLPRRYERLALRLMSFVIVVAEEQEARLVRAGYDPSRIAIVRNTPEQDVLRQLSEELGVDDAPLSGRYILYSGFMDRHRGLKTLVLAFDRIRDRFPDLKLVLIGRGNASAELERLAGELGLGDRVIFKGWLDFRLIPRYIRNSTVCVIPHLKSEHTDTTVPNKIFDYMYFGKPLVVSDALPLVRILRELRCGTVFRSGDPVDLARALTEALTTPYSPHILKKGKQLVEKKYNWENDSRILVRLIDAHR